MFQFGASCALGRDSKRSVAAGEEFLQIFTTSDGARIAYEEKGKGRPLVLLHGLMANRSFFRAQDPLADEFRLISADLRGHGDSGGTGEEPTIKRLAEDVAELADHLDLEGAIGLGWSLGASVLWHVLTGRARDRFAAAIVVDMTPRVLNDGAWSLGLSREVCEARAAAIVEDYEGFTTSAGAAIFAQPLGRERRALADWAAAEFARNDPAVTASLWSSLVGEDARALLGRIRQPTLVVHGANSHLYGSDTADHLVAALPNAEAVQFERSGHSPHLEQPDLFNRNIRQFAAKLPRVRETQDSI
jgi:pimeloyl-[acyl-carrier protein] methyl ester esterase